MVLPSIARQSGWEVRVNQGENPTVGTMIVAGGQFGKPVHASDG